jgi:hypothetical protein
MLNRRGGLAFLGLGNITTSSEGWAESYLYDQLTAARRYLVIFLQRNREETFIRCVEKNLIVERFNVRYYVAHWLERRQGRVSRRT